MNDESTFLGVRVVRSRRVQTLAHRLFEQLVFIRVHVRHVERPIEAVSSRHVRVNIRHRPRWVAVWHADANRTYAALVRVFVVLVAGDDVIREARHAAMKELAHGRNRFALEFAFKLHLLRCL